MKTKILLTSALAISIACPAMSDPLPAITSCTEPQIGTATGPASLEADWTANTITLKYKNQGTDFDTGECTYNEDFTLPTAPTRTGYNFAGWKVKPSAFDLSTLDTSIGGTAYGYSRLNGNAGDKEATYNLTQGSGEWATEFSYGTIKGMAKCSALNGDNHNDSWGGNSSDWTAEESELTSASGEAKYCWCQVTGFDAEKDGTYMSVNVSPSSWVLGGNSGYADGCAKGCAKGCAIFAHDNNVQLYSNFRAALFGLAANK